MWASVWYGSRDAQVRFGPSCLQERPKVGNDVELVEFVDVPDVAKTLGFGAETEGLGLSTLTSLDNQPMLHDSFRQRQSPSPAQVTSTPQTGAGTWSSFEGRNGKHYGPANQQARALNHNRDLDELRRPHCSLRRDRMMQAQKP